MYQNSPILGAIAMCGIGVALIAVCLTVRLWWRRGDREPYCCYMDRDKQCPNEATRHIQFGEGFEDYTESCDEHIGPMVLWGDSRDVRVTMLEDL